MTHPATYRERLSVPARWWALAGLLVASFWLALVVALPGALPWLVTAVAALVAGSLLTAYGVAPVEVDSRSFRAGRAVLPLEYVGAVEPLHRDDARRAAGVDADARAYLVLRPYVAGAVRVWLTDPADPAPYWLVSTRNPTRLAEVLAQVAAQRRAPEP